MHILNTYPRFARDWLENLYFQCNNNSFLEESTFYNNSKNATQRQLNLIFHLMGVNMALYLLEKYYI